ncbi:MAG: acyl-CoA thioesterase domain-containing protein [Ilumatobacteraceae bacterium]
MNSPSAGDAHPDLGQMFELELHGPDTYVGSGPRYPWGGLYGGQIVAQALRAAAATVDSELNVHSLRAYFIRRGDHSEPIRFEVDRIRNGRSFATRRVVARQAVGAILNLEASFQHPEESPDVQTVEIPDGLTSPDDLPGSSWTDAFERRFVPHDEIARAGRPGAGAMAAWMKVNGDLGGEQLLHRCWLAYLSDDLPSDTVGEVHPSGSPSGPNWGERIYGASLDHTIWFHRPIRADRWHLHELTCHNLAGGRGLVIGHVFGTDGVLAATIAQ